ncbi:MAG TPA: hypothetical protein VLG12_07605 [Candidatus Saccharimonadales bacterium]|nr:hypothetical protein [Candidatus Saccharimonadales bacterium]
MSKTQTKILEEYQEKTDELVQRMYKLLLKVYRRADDAAYRKILEELEK